MRYTHVLKCFFHGLCPKDNWRQSKWGVLLKQLNLFPLDKLGWVGVVSGTEGIRKIKDTDTESRVESLLHCHPSPLSKVSSIQLWNIRLSRLWVAIWLSLFVIVTCNCIGYVYRLYIFAIKLLHPVSSYSTRSILHPLRLDLKNPLLAFLRSLASKK